MDAVKYIKELNRMCEAKKECSDCYAKGTCNFPDAEKAEEAVAAVEKWSREHPEVTNGHKILEMIPSYLRSTTIKTADSEAFDGSITAKDHIELRIVKDWWDAEYKEESND